MRGIERARQEIRAQARVPVPGSCSRLKPELELDGNDQRWGFVQEARVEVRVLESALEGKVCGRRGSDGQRESCGGYCDP